MTLFGFGGSDQNGGYGMSDLNYPDEELAMITQLATASVGRPITRAGVSFFPLYVHQSSVQLDTDATRVAISEQPGATVPSLRVENDGSLPVLLVEGETVIGGHQNRVVNVSVLVPANGAVDLPV